ncbi:uncharacterized protein LOC136030509 [Artemia franciscana]|uniref:G-protein coupled receptors family 2 profile 2 domain-containing protein n=1 Tax=Artemia franciscana TaxID=6661 RepID=A0AA88HHB4_ARTSF|nr:hypothetical protein QYM36_015865 [Artemia franciscana]
MREYLKLLIICTCFIHIAAVKKCCEDNEYFNTVDRKCEGLANKAVNFSVIAEEFQTKFGVASGICLDLTQSGIFVLKSNESPKLFVNESFCFDTTEMSTEYCYENEDQLILKNFKTHPDNHSFCEETMIVTPSWNIRILNGSATKEKYNIRSCTNLGKSPMPMGKNVTFFKKCCKENDIFNDQYQCTKAKANLYPLFLDSEGNEITDSSFTVLSTPRKLLDCKSLEIVDYDLFEQPSFGIIPGGKLSVFPYEVHSTYCVEALVSKNQTYMVGLICGADVHDEIEVTLFPWFYMIALPFVLATLVVHLLLPELQNLQGQIVMSHVTSLFLLFLLLTLNRFFSPWTPDLCVTIGILLHFFYLSSYSWLTVKGLHLTTLWSLNWRVSPFNNYATVSILGWGLPGIIVIFAILAQYLFMTDGIPARPGYGVATCFLNRYGPGRPLLWYLYFPIGIMLTIITVTFLTIMTLTWVSGLTAKRLAPTNGDLLKTRLMNVVRISIVMGLTWIADFISFLDGSTSLMWVVVDILNILTSIYFFYFYVCKKRVAQFLYKRYPRFFPYLSGFGARANQLQCNTDHRKLSSHSNTSNLERSSPTNERRDFEDK